MKDQAAFIKEFNRLYRDAGIVIEPIEHSAANCSPGKQR